MFTFFRLLFVRHNIQLETGNDDKAMFKQIVFYWERKIEKEETLTCLPGRPKEGKHPVESL